ncbi:MAG: hypothetical protein Q7U86_11160 [Draconibacterium sp.]|nr:hypothetical protein [Draconibacterium sp.]
MKTKILKNRLSFILMKVIMTTLLFLIIQGMSFTNVFADELPFDQNEVQKLRAFLESQSMIAGKTNGDLLGVDINNPGTWAKWGGNNWFPRPSNQHAVEIQWKHHSFAGSLDISDFQYLGYFVLECYGSSNFNSITFRNSSLGWGLVLKSVMTKELRIINNEGLGSLWLSGKVDVLTLEQPKLARLETNTLGNIPPDLAKFTELSVLKLSGISNISNWKLANYPHLREVSLDGVDNITSLSPTNCPRLGGISINNMPDLKTINLKSDSIGGLYIRKTHIKELDLTGVPNLISLGCELNWELTSLKITDKPHFEIVEVKGNPALRSLEFANLPKQKYYFSISDNEMLTEIVLKNLPQLSEISCIRNGLTSLDVSGLPALTSLAAFDNQLTKFNAQGIVFKQLNLLWGNKLTEVSANVGGHNIHLKAYGKGGHVLFDAGPGYWMPFGIELDYKELPAPNNTMLEKVEGAGFPPDKNDWFFLLEKDINATFFFKADIHFLNYFADFEGDEPDEDEGEWDSDANLNIDSRVGNSFKLPEEFPKPSKTGFEIHGWFTDSTLTREWIFGKDTLKGELILYPKWLPKGMPVVLSVKRQSPTTENTSASKLTYLVTFSKTVSGVDISDFKLTTEGTVTGKIASVSAANGNTISVEVNTIAGTGTLRLDVKNTGTGIVDSGSNPLAGGYTSGELYRVGPTTGISDPVAINSDCTIFPNPTTGKVNITAPENETFSRIEVFNIQGKQVLLCDHP